MRRPKRIQLEAHIHFQEHRFQKPGTLKLIQLKNISLLDLTAAGKAGLNPIASVPKSAYHRKIHRKSLCSMQLCTYKCKLIAPAKSYTLRSTYTLSSTYISRGNYSMQKLL